MNPEKHRCLRTTITLLLVFFFGCDYSAAQTQTAPKVLTLEGAVNYALKNYPRVRVALEQVLAAHGGVSLAKSAYLPRADMLWQGNRATRNNVFGMLLQQSVISPVSGPVLPSASNDSVWGSAAGVLVSWEPFDFGRRRADVGVARSGENLAQSDLSVTRLDVVAAIASAFLRWHLCRTFRQGVHLRYAG